MVCPACKNKLEPKTECGIEVDVCINACGGIWFDDQELNKLDKGQCDLTTETLFAGRNQNNTIIDHSKERNCPKCSSVKLNRHFFYEDKKLEIDTCPSCKGIWLDAGELSTLIKEQKSEGLRDTVYNKFNDDSFNNASSKIKAVLDLLFK